MERRGRRDGEEEEEENEVGRDGRAVRLDYFPDAELRVSVGGDSLEGRPKAIPRSRFVSVKSRKFRNGGIRHYVEDVVRIKVQEATCRNLKNPLGVCSFGLKIMGIFFKEIIAIFAFDH